MKKLLVMADGGSRGNPGPAAGAGVVFELTDMGEMRELAAIGKYVGVATNNVAEYTGLIEGLRAAQRFGAQPLEVRLDSELIIKQLRGEYRVKDAKMKVLNSEAWELLRFFPSVTFTHVRREFNARADALVNQTLDEAVL